MIYIYIYIIYVSNTCSIKFFLFQKIASEYRSSILLEVTLHTGRKHQIRSILSFFGMPIIGDKKYGSKIEIKNKVYLLAYKLEFNNLPPPLTYLNGKVFTIEGEKLNLWKIN